MAVLVLGAGTANELERFRACLASHDRSIEHAETSPSRLPGLTNRVQVLGWVESVDLPRYWAMADLALFPCEDNLLVRAKSPLRLVEMMAAGLPIVAHRVGEVERYLENGASGLLVPAGDDEAFVNAVAELASSTELRRRLGAQARQRVERDFNWHRLAARVEALYQQVLDLG